MKVTERNIKPLFANYGTVSHCLVLESRGYGFVQMPNPKEARRAIRDLDGCSVGGCRISVELSNEHGESKTSIRHKTKPCDDPESVEDCYFFQNESCGRNSQCPFLHRILSGMICKKFLFKKCKRAAKCGKHHVHCSELPPPPEDELARVMRVRKKQSEKVNEEITGASSQHREKSSPAPDSYFQCLDCRFLATSCFLLETHLNTEEHWEKVKQVKLDGEELKGILGDRGDVMCEVCEVRVPERELEEHRQDELHMIMMHRNSNHEDWVTVGENVLGNNVERDKPDDIHVCHIPKGMTLSTFRKICSRYGEVSKLKFLPQGNHAYVGYASKDAREFAAIKLKELQRNHFAGVSDLLIGISGSEDEESEKDNVTKICIFRNGHYEDGYLCDECGAVCNSMKQHSLHTSSHCSHDRWKSNNADQECVKETVPVSDLSEYTDVKIARSESRPAELEVGDGYDPESELSCVQESQVADAHADGLLHLRELNNQIEELMSLRNEEEKKLVLCQRKMAICKQTSKSNVETLELLEEELEIQRNLRDVEKNIGKLTIDFNNSMYPSTTLQEDGQFHQLSDQFCYLGNSVKSGHHSNPLSKPFFHPDDLFDSDDSLDE